MTSLELRNNKMEKDAKKQKRECCEGLKQLETRLANLERERNALVFHKKGEFRISEAKEAEEEDLKLALQRKAEKRDLQEQLHKIRTSVSKLHKALSNVKATPAYVAKLKETMEDIEGAMLNFKEKQRMVYEELLSEEQVTNQDIAAFEKRLEAWSRSNDRDTLPAPGKGTRAVHMGSTENTPAAVAAFEKFLVASGGHSGGWDDYDHQIFLKVKSRYHSEQEGLIEALLRDLPARNREDLEGHEQWHQKYLSLLEEKKMAIAEWREERKAMKDDLLPPATEDGDSVQKKHASAKERLIAKEREERLAKLAEWKTQQLAKKDEEEKHRLAELQKAAKAKEKMKQRQLEVKAQVEERVRQKAVERERRLAGEEAQREEERVQRKLANKELERFRQRDMRAVEEKMKKKQKEELDREEKERRLERLKEKVEVQHDPSRLYQLTAGWEERRKQSSTQETGDVFISARDVPRRAVPSWRQGV